MFFFVEAKLPQSRRWFLLKASRAVMQVMMITAERGWCRREKLMYEARLDEELKRILEKRGI